MAKKETKKVEFDGRIWPNLLDYNVNMDAQLISKSNFIFGASTLILVFILNKLATPNLLKTSTLANLPMFILLVGSFFSSLLSIMIVLPRMRLFSKKQRINKDIFYYKNIRKFYTRASYHAYIKDLPTDNKRIGEAYANQIYSLATNVIPYKFKLLKISGWILMSSIFLSFFSYFLTYFLLP
ncbi:MAG: DUF5706 domain-containing protein [Candidatus Buchananbacteria bacterium]|nr:DUF5706 domain-containing protein [Candidatus Buchananbacteria bacterium]